MEVLVRSMSLGGLSRVVFESGRYWKSMGGTGGFHQQWHCYRGFKVEGTDCLMVLWALYHQQGAFTNKNGGSNRRNGCVGLCRVICFKDQQRCELKNGLLLLLLETHHLGRGTIGQQEK